MHALVGKLLEFTKMPAPALEPQLVPGSTRPGRPARRGIFFMASIAVFGAMLGSLASAVLQGGGGQARPETLAPESTPAPAPDGQGELALGEVLSLIHAGEHDDAASKWEAEVVRRDGLGHPSVDATLLVAGAFLEAAEALETRDRAAARVPGRHARHWYAIAANDLHALGKDASSAETVVDQTRRFKPPD
jgi:hypothetical protein